MAVDGSDSGTTNRRDDDILITGAARTGNMAADPLAQVKADARRARINAVWEQLNCNGSSKTSSSVLKKSVVGEEKPKQKKTVPGWMVSLGMAPKKGALINLNSNNLQVPGEEVELKMQPEARSKESVESSEDARKIAAAALAAVKQANAVGKEGKIEVNEVREFAGEQVKLRKFVDPNSKEAQMAQEKARMQASSSSGLDALLDQISKKRKLNILDKSKKDWGEFKEEKGLLEELDAYNKSGGKYLDKLSFLQKADLREFERERDIRLAQQARRRVDSQKD